MFRKNYVPGIGTVQTQPRKYVLDHADYIALTKQNELDRTDHTEHTDYIEHTVNTYHTDHTYQT